MAQPCMLPCWARRGGRAWRCLKRCALGPQIEIHPTPFHTRVKNWNSPGTIGGMLIIGVVFSDDRSPNLKFHLNWLFSFLLLWPV